MQRTTSSERNAWRAAAGGLRSLLVVVGVAAAMTIGSAVAQNAGDVAAGGITVSGTGVAYGEPDQAVLTVGVSVPNEAVRTALGDADARMSAVRAALVAGGVAELDIRTASFNVWRQDIYDDKGNPQGERYHVEHQFEVVVRNVASVGELLAASVEAGANSVGGITYTIANPDELMATARAAAMHDAMARAEQLAGLAGVKLTAPTSIVEASSGGQAPQYDVRFSMAADNSSPVSGGQLAVQVSVSVTYAIAAEE